MRELLDLTREFSQALDRLDLDFDGYVYNPLDYAWDNHREFLSRYVRKGCPAVFLGINPGPFGMVQTGVPFGSVEMVRSYLKISHPVGRPAREHPARPVLGFDCPRIEVSGRRFWGLAASRFPDADDFFDLYTVVNYCPLAFIDKGRTARNITPDNLGLPPDQRRALSSLCDAYVRDALGMIGCRTLIGVGTLMERKLRALFPSNPRIFSILHPSPASPAANTGWAAKVSQKLRGLGMPGF